MTNGEQLLKDAKEMTAEEFREKYNGIKPHCRHCEAVQGKPCIKDCNKGMQDWLNAEVPKEYPLSFIELFDFAYGTVFEGQKSNEVYSLGMHSLASKEIVSDRYRVISRSELPSK